MTRGPGAQLMADKNAQEYMKGRKTLELNASHSIVQALAGKVSSSPSEAKVCSLRAGRQCSCPLCWGACCPPGAEPPARARAHAHLALPAGHDRAPVRRRAGHVRLCGGVAQGLWRPHLRPHGQRAVQWAQQRRHRAQASAAASQRQRCPGAGVCRLCDPAVRECGRWLQPLGQLRHLCPSPSISSSLRVPILWLSGAHRHFPVGARS